jgi:hypothetical protein
VSVRNFGRKADGEAGGNTLVLAIGSFQRYLVSASLVVLLCVAIRSWVVLECWRITTGVTIPGRRLGGFARPTMVPVLHT